MNKKALQLLRKLFTEKRYAELYYIFKRLWEKQSWLYLKRNSNAVVRIKQVFTQLTGNQPYQSSTNIRFWDEQIGRYVDQVGVAALINDMKAAIKTKSDIKSIVYFLYTKDGASRWELLTLEHIEQSWHKEKQKHNTEYEELAKLIDFRMPGPEPDWVMDARKRLKFLQNKGKHHLTEDEKREIRKIEFHLGSYGYL
ncbi:MAG: hypothetical protein GWN59_08205 [Calditrichae bacterium]|nr:hypothetical protein [candidate division KSB1 bacterium]NIS28103.1 hypothetical protein [candidate division KSB1 bacterium]NIV04565.1 hypothetical protein [Calditrichia bacterium]NIV73166.1 hypothetical protein [Calditrichia bacterium]NIW73311.1 hypothetical protein [candidate division KSB1 bacterium]